MPYFREKNQGTKHFRDLHNLGGYEESFSISYVSSITLLKVNSLNVINNENYHFHFFFNNYRSSSLDKITIPLSGKFCILGEKTDLLFE
jgi:hypothetical protein